MSMRTTSGRWRPARETASAPSAASATGLVAKDTLTAGDDTAFPS